MILLSKKEKQNMKKWIVLSVIVVMCIITAIFGISAAAEGNDAAHENCQKDTAVTVSSQEGLRQAIQNGSGDIDIVLAGGEITVSETISVPANKTVHIMVADGETATLKRSADFVKEALFDVAADGKLILGDGSVTYDGGDLTAAAETGNYEVNSTGGKMIIDGGAVWDNAKDWTPGSSFGDNTGMTAVLYDENGNHKLYTNSGTVASAALITSSGTLDVWGGVTLQNNVSSGNAGSAIKSDNGSTLNMYGGEVRKCVLCSNSGDTGRGAVFIGNFESNNWNSNVVITDTHFNMYGGKITENAASGGYNQDGGGVSVEQAYMDMYGGEVSRNHAGVYFNESSGDGGGFMVRNNAEFTMWGGSVSQNFAGGYGGGVVAWNAKVYIKGGYITHNTAAYGGGLAIASSNNQNSDVKSYALMEGGRIAYNEAIQDTAANRSSAGVGGGICVGTGTRVMGSSLDLKGGVISQNVASNGGGLGVYAGGDGTAESDRNTAVSMSGDFSLINNAADFNGNGMYVTNENANNKHYLVKMSGAACVDTNNPVYFENLCSNQIPVLVEENLTTTGTAAIFEFANSFWNGTDRNYDKASANRNVIKFADGVDIQENKIALDNTSWYLKARTDNNTLALQRFDASPQYTIRNGTPVTVNGLKYYRIYESLDEAFVEAADGDSLYIFYNTTVDKTALLAAGKHVTLMAESTSSAGRDASLSGSGRDKTCWLDTSSYGYDVMEGAFLQYVGTGGNYNGAYNLDPDSTTSYNVRNDYTVTLSKNLCLGDPKKGAGIESAAVVVSQGANLEIGQMATAGMGAGALTFDGNSSYPVEGSMFCVNGEMTLHSGVSITNHSNYSEAHPGAIEVAGAGKLIVENGVVIKNNVSPIAGAVYVGRGGSFSMQGGELGNNIGGMPRHGFVNTSGSKLDGYDKSYWGQAAYYYGAGAVYNLGSFTMSGGSISGNRGEYGAVCNVGSGSIDLQSGSITDNHAVTLNGSDTDYDLSISGYTEVNTPVDVFGAGAGSGGGLFISGSTKDNVIGSGMTISGNTAVENGGGVALASCSDLTRIIAGYETVAGGYENNGSPALVPVYRSSTMFGSKVNVNLLSGAVISGNTAGVMGGGIYLISNGNSINVAENVTMQNNIAGVAGGGLAAVFGSEATFANEITGNTAKYGGGVYVGGAFNATTTVTARGRITSNWAANGAGAYVDCVTDKFVSGEQQPMPVDPGEKKNTSTADEELDNLLGNDKEDTNGLLILDGAVINNNRLNANGFGMGIYNRGDLRLTAAAGNQPSVSYNDRIFLERNHVITLAADYDISRSEQNANNRLTLDSRVTENGTDIMTAANAEQAAAILNSGFATHYTHYLAQRGNSEIIELNSIPVVYYDRFNPAEGLSNHRVEVAYRPGDEVVLQSYDVGEDADFTMPDGKGFLYWVVMDQNGNYLNINGDIVASAAEAQRYYAGNRISNIMRPLYLEAVYGDTQYTATLLTLDENDQLTHDLGNIELPNADYNGTTGGYSFRLGTDMEIRLGAPANQQVTSVLQGLAVYEKTDDSKESDFTYAGSYWKQVTKAVMETEELNIPVKKGEQPLKYSVCSTGRIADVDVKESTTVASVNENGNMVYKAADKDILIVANLKQAMVQLNLEASCEHQEDNFIGYYDNMHQAITAVATKIQEKPSDDHRHVFVSNIKLLAANTDEVDESSGRKIVKYYGELGNDADNCIDNDLSGYFAAYPNDIIDISYDLNGFALDYQQFGERNLRHYDMKIHDGKIIYNRNTDTGSKGIKAAFRVADGVLTLENVEIETTYKDEQVYSAKVMENGTLNVGKGCVLNEVFVHSDKKFESEALNGGEEGDSGYVTVTDEFAEDRTTSAATLCLDRWGFENGARRVILLSEEVAADKGVSIRKFFNLKDVDTDGEDDAIKWFIGTDGKLYKKAACIIPKIECDNKVQQILTEYWAYNNAQGKPEISGKEPEHAGEPVWLGGYPFFYDYQSVYGFDSSVMGVKISAQLTDADGQPLKINRGTVSFVASRVDDVNDTNRRNFSGRIGLDENGYASINFDALNSLPVTDQPDLDKWTAPTNYLAVTASWSGSGQYAPQYMEYWNYAYGIEQPSIVPTGGNIHADDPEPVGDREHEGLLGTTLTGAVRLTISPKPLSDDDISLSTITPGSAEYIGEKGRENGYSSSPSVRRITDKSLGRVLTPGVDYNTYFAALTTSIGDGVLRDENGQPVECRIEGSSTVYYYLAGENGGKMYYTLGGSGSQDATSPENGANINGAPAGPYSVALESDTLSDPNYSGESGWKETIFTISPYANSLSVTGPNHMVIGEDESYLDNIKSVLSDAYKNDEFKVFDRYGNEIPWENCSVSFETISGSAALDSNGVPSSSGLYNIVITAESHGKGTVILDGVEENADIDSNYSNLSKGYMALLISNEPLEVFVIPERVEVPYTGEVYTDEVIKKLDGASGYQVWKCRINAKGEPVNADGNVIDLQDIPTEGANAERLQPSQYRLEIGSLHHIPRDVGSYTMIATSLSGEYIGIANVDIISDKTNSVSLSSDSGVYTGVNHVPAVTVTDDEGKVLTQNRDYVISITDSAGHIVAAPINADVYTYHINGINNYVGCDELTATYTVNAKSLAENSSDVDLAAGIRDVILDAPQFDYYRGVSVVPSYSLYYNGMLLTRGAGEGFDYSQVITDNLGRTIPYIDEPGMYTFTITGKGNYKDTRVFTLDVRAEDTSGDLHLTNDGEYIYNGGAFESYDWLSNATVNWTPEGGTTIELNPGSFNITIRRAETGDVVPANAVLDAGVYTITLQPTADYVEDWADWGLSADASCSCVMRIQRCAVTITVHEQSKIFGQNDPDFAGISGASSYTTDLAGAEANGFYAHDANNISGQFSRNQGEDVQNGGYRYILGSFSAGHNYVLNVSLNNVFNINPKSLNVPANPEDDDITVDYQQKMSYTGYGRTPVRSVVYNADNGSKMLSEDANYVLKYELWHPSIHEDQTDCLPDCECGKGRWEGFSGLPVNAGWYRVTISGEDCNSVPDNYTGSRSYLFEIETQGGSLDLSVEGEDTVTYKNGEYTPTVMVRREGFLLPIENYSLGYSFAPADGSPVSTGPFVSGVTSFSDAGVYTIYASGSGNYVGSSGSVRFEILPKNLAADDIAGGTQPVDIQLTDSEEFIYNGNPQQANVSAVYNDDSLVNGTDYTLVYSNHVNAGDSAAVTVSGRGNYTGSRVLTYNIKPKTLTVEVKGAEKVYGAPDPVYTYDISGEGNISNVSLTGSVWREPGENVGTYDFKLEGATLSAGDNYTLSLAEDQKLTITKKSLGDGAVTAESISVSAPSYVAVDETTVDSLVNSTEVIYWSSAMGRQQLNNNTDYTVTVKSKDSGAVVTGNLSQGEYVMEVVAKENSNYSGGFRLDVVAMDASYLINLGSGDTVVYKPAGYKEHIEPRVGDNMLTDCTVRLTATYANKQPQTSNIALNADGSFDLPLTDAGTYTVVVSKNQDNGGLYFGTVTYVVLPKNIAEGNNEGAGEVSVNEPEGDFSYTGKEVKPANADELLVYAGKTVYAADEDGSANYIVSYADNVNPGTATMTIYGQGNYTGTRTVNFTVGEIRYRMTYNENGATSGFAGQDTSLYMSGDMATVIGNVGNMERVVSGSPGYKAIFLGWSPIQTNIIKDRSELSDLYSSGSQYTIADKDVTMYAVWAADENNDGIADCDENRYRVEYKTNSSAVTGSVPVDSATYLRGESVTVMENVGTLKLSGYVLLGWTPDAIADGAGYLLSNSEDYFNFVSKYNPYSAGRTFTMGGENITLYAVWGRDANNNGVVDWMESEAQYFITYDANGGTGELPKSSILTTGVLDVEIPEYDPAKLTRTGCVLIGWTVTERNIYGAYPQPVADGSCLNEADGTVTADNGSVYHCYPLSGGTHFIDEGSPNPVVFYALWAVDDNNNGIPDYEEERYTISYENLESGGVTLKSALPEAVERLGGSNITLAQEPAGSYMDGGASRDAVFLGWTTDKGAAGKLYGRGEIPSADLCRPGDIYTLAAEDVTFYAVWGVDSYNTAEYNINVAAATGGTATADKTTALEGENVLVTIKAQDGYALDEVLVNNVPRRTLNYNEADNSYTMQLTNVKEHKYVVVTFVKSDFSVIWPEPKTYNGSKQAPELNITSGGAKLDPADFDIKVSYAGEEAVDFAAAEFTNAGAYTITVSGKGAYAGSEVSVLYVINPQALGNVKLKDYERVYNGSPFEDEIDNVMSAKGSILTKDVDYNVSYADNVNVGTATVTVSGCGNYSGTISKTFEIKSTGLMVKLENTDITYDGQPHQLAPQVMLNGEQLTENVDYTLSYSDDLINAGEVKVTVTGIGNFADSKKEVAYTIKPKSLAADDTTDNTNPVNVLTPPDQVYTGSAITLVPDMVYAAGSTVMSLVQNKDYTLSYKANTERGTATVTVTGKGNYQGERAVTFKITDYGNAMNMESLITKTYGGVGINLSQADLGVKLGDSAFGGQYDVTYVPATGGASLNDKNKPLTAGTYLVTVRGKGQDGGVSRGTLVVSPAELTKLETEGDSFDYDGSPQSPAIKAVTSDDVAAALTEGEDYAVSYRDSAGNVTTAPPAGYGAYTLVVTGVNNFTGVLEKEFNIISGDLKVSGIVSDHIYDGLPYLPAIAVVNKDGKYLTENVDYTLTYPAAAVTAGKYTIDVAGINGYKDKQSSAEYKIVQKALDDSQNNSGRINVAVSDTVFDGTAQTPPVIVTYITADGRALFLTENDYTVEYTNNTAVGTATLTVTAKEGSSCYSGSCKKTFNINNASGKSLTVQVEGSAVYDGKTHEPAVTVLDGEQTVTACNITYSPMAGTGAKLSDDGKPLNAGVYYVNVSGSGDYDGYAGSGVYVITPAAMTDVAVQGSYTYNGKEQTPAVNVKGVGGAALKEGEDFDLICQNNVNAGTATVAVVGRGNYTGTLNQTFTIAKASLEIAPAKTTKVYGEADGQLFDPDDYPQYQFEGSLTRAAGENAGEYNFNADTLRETSGNYQVVVNDTFDILPKDLNDNDVKKAVDMTVGYTGQSFSNVLAMYYQAESGNLLLTEGKDNDYTLRFEQADPESGALTEVEPVAAGTYIVTVSANENNYTGEYTFNLTIDEAVPGVEMSAEDAVVTYNGSDWAANMKDRLQVFGNGNKLSDYELTFTDPDGNEVSEIINAGIYTVQVEAAGYQPAAVTFAVMPKDIADNTVGFTELADREYSGMAIEPQVQLTDGAAALAKDTDYTVEYSGNINVGAANVVISGCGNYTGVRTEHFAITARALTPADVAVSDLADVVYNGQIQMQKPEITLNGKALTENVDYTLTYNGDLVNVTAEGITADLQFIGNYSGNLAAAAGYKIKPCPIEDSWLDVQPAAMVYTGGELQPMVNVVDALNGNVRLTSGTDYDLTYDKNQNVGTADVTVEGKGNYSGTATAHFTITAAAAGLNVRANPTALTYNGGNQKPEIVVTSEGNKADYTAEYTYNGKPMGSFDDAEFIDVGVYVINVSGKGNHEGAGGSAVFTILADTFTVEPVGEQDYTGRPVTPQLEVIGTSSGKKLQAGKDYVVSYTDNTALGDNATALVTGLGNYAGCTQTIHFTITGKNTLFEVVYFGNENTAGHVPKDENRYLADSSATVLNKLPGFAKTGAVFLGWSTDKTDLIDTKPKQDALTIYEAGSQLLIKDHTALYAVWAKDSDHNGRPDYAESVSITSSAGEGGSINPAGKNIVEWGKDKVVYQITVANGYTLSGVTVDNQNVAVSTDAAPTPLVRNEDGSYTYTFTNIREDHVILVNISKNGSGGGGGGGSTIIVQPPGPVITVDPDNSGVSEWLNTDDHSLFMIGRENGLFFPGAQVTRAEAAMVFYRLLREQNVPITVDFVDVKDGAWYADAVRTLASLGMLEGIGDGVFEPERAITRAEFAALAVRFAQSADVNNTYTYNDVAKGAWYYDDVLLASHYGWVNGYPDGSFGPNNIITRAEIAKLVNNMTGRLIDKTAIDNGAGKRFSDVARTHWAFYDIVEASTTHDFHKQDDKEIWQVQ